MDSTVCLLLASWLVAYQTPAEDPLSLSVELVNAAGVPDRVALAAAEEASRIFSGSRVHLTWIQKHGTKP